MSTLRFAYSTINWGTTPDLKTVFDAISSAGWNAVELFMHSLDWLGPQKQLEETLGDLTVATSFGMVNLPVDTVQQQMLHNQIAYAAQAGASHYGLIGGNRLRWRPPSEEEYAELAACCEELARFGAELGIDVAYHPHTACTIETESEIDLLMEQTEHLSLCLDVSHIAVVGEDPIAHLRKFRDRTSYVHLKDWGYGKFVEMGQGTLAIDFAEFLAELEATQFPGWVVVEQSRSDISPRHSAQANADFLRQLGYDPGSVG